MNYSYIKPRKKSPLTQEMQLMLAFFSMTLIMLFATYFFLLYKNYSFQKTKLETAQHRLILQEDIKRMQSQIDYINKQYALSEKIYTQNGVLKDSITNLFDLVPERITLSQAVLTKNGLILYGITPNKDVYNFMLEAPLRSIFHRSYSSFYPAQNGWLHFVSTNYIDNEDEELDSED